MIVLGYVIPLNKHDDDFIKSLHKQFIDKGKLSSKQESALKSAIDVEEDFFEYDIEIPEDDPLFGDFYLLKAKFKRNRFRFTASKNNCIRAMKSIIYNNQDYGLINKSLGRDQDYSHRYY